MQRKLTMDDLKNPEKFTGKPKEIAKKFGYSRTDALSAALKGFGYRFVRVTTNVWRIEKIK